MLGYLSHKLTIKYKLEVSYVWCCVYYSGESRWSNSCENHQFLPHHNHAYNHEVSRQEQLLSRQGMRSYTFQENKLLFYSSAMLTFQQLFILFIIHCLLIPLQIELFLQSSSFLNKISPVIFSWPLPICLKLIMLAKAFWELSPNPSSEIEWQYIKQCFWWKCQFWSSLQ